MRFRSAGLFRNGATGGALQTAAREALAFARQGILMRHDTAEPIVPSGVAAGDDVVVFLHGLFATAGVLRPLRAAVSRYPAVHTAALTYFPGPGVEAVAARLGGVVDALPKGANIHLVGHSLGGIVARWFALQARDPRVVQTISLASPFAGVPSAAWLGLDSGRDLHPRSHVLRHILLHPGAAEIPHLSIIAGADTLIDAPIKHALPGGDVVVMEARGHNSLLFDEDVARTIVQRILGRRRAPPPAR